jgi:leucyl/phenylalanyl-tRNA---protein transferase
MMRIVQLDPRDPAGFPPVERALTDPNGLLAFGGDLSPQRLLAAYSRGIFPWYSAGDPLLWWSPDPRCVFVTDRLHVSRSLARMLRKSKWTWSIDNAFERVMRECAAPRADQDGTWITPDMILAYTMLHRMGHAHSLEIWDRGDLVGGIYGVAVGKLFSAESMFSRIDNTSKAALLALAQFLRAHELPWIDAQVPNAHLLRMGAVTIPRSRYVARLQGLAAADGVAEWPHARSPVCKLGEFAQQRA